MYELLCQARLQLDEAFHPAGKNIGGTCVPRPASGEAFGSLSLQGVPASLRRELGAGSLCAFS